MNSRDDVVWSSIESFVSGYARRAGFPVLRRPIPNYLSVVDRNGWTVLEIRQQDGVLMIAHFASKRDHQDIVRCELDNQRGFVASMWIARRAINSWKHVDFPAWTGDDE